MSVLARCRALNQSYGGSHTLWDVDLDVPTGSRTCLMGRNGMGKTTLLKCIMGLLPATSGDDDVRRDRSAARCRPRARARLGIGYVPQGREIFSQLTVEENLRVGLGVRKNGARTIPDADLRSVSGAEADAATGAAAICPAASSSSSRSAARWCSSRSC